MRGEGAPMNSPDLLSLARAVLARNRPQMRDSAWDSRGTAAETVSQVSPLLGHLKARKFNDKYPLSHCPKP
jgi:hypothetical protein